jgi:hypothetical protein
VPFESFLFGIDFARFPIGAHRIQFKLGRVDGFNEDEAQSKSNERAIVLVGFLAA